MTGVFSCIISLAIANFGIAALHSVPHYQSALGTTWSQAFAVLIYYFIWVKE
jgi:hypothetical protein